MAAAAQGQPVELPALPGEAVQAQCPQLRHCCPRLCPSLGFLGSLEAAFCTENVLMGPVVHQWAQGEAQGAGCPFQWKDQSQLCAPSFSLCSFLALAQGNLVTHLTASYSCFLQALSPKHSLGLPSTFYFSGSDKCDNLGQVSEARC